MSKSIEEQIGPLKVPGGLGDVSLDDAARELAMAKEKYDTAYAAVQCEGQIKAAWRALQPALKAGETARIYRLMAIVIVHAYKKGLQDQRKDV